LLLVGAAVLLGACGSSSPKRTQSSSTSASPSAPALGYEGIPLEQGSQLAPPSTTGTGTVDGIQCGPTEQLAYHVHAHLAVYVNGQPRALPAGVGIPGALVQQTQDGPVVGQGQCFYWLHTHTSDGVIHIESPTQRIYTLGNFFDEWHQPLSESQVGPDSGKVTAFLNGKPWTKTPRDIPLEGHFVVQLDVGSPAPPYQAVSFDNTQL